eukprot:gene1977-2246_t
MDGTKLRIISWLMSNINSLVALAQLNSMLAVHCDNLFQIEQQQLLSVVDQSTAKILRLRKQIKKSSSKRRVRRFWERPGRVSTWWENFINNVVVPEEWMENFRMSKGSFFTLCYELQPFIEKDMTTMRHVIHSCFILNNYCEMQKESVGKKLYSVPEPTMTWINQELIDTGATIQQRKVEPKE